MAGLPFCIRWYWPRWVLTQFPSLGSGRYLAGILAVPWILWISARRLNWAYHLFSDHYLQLKLLLSYFSAEDDEVVFSLLFLSGLLEIGGNGPSEAFGKFSRISNLSRFISAPTVATGSEIQILLPSSISELFFYGSAPNAKRRQYVTTNRDVEVPISFLETNELLHSMIDNSVVSVVRFFIIAIHVVFTMLRFLTRGW